VDAELAATPRDAAPEPHASAAITAAPVPTPEAPAPLEGQDFAREVREIFGVAACGGTDAPPAMFDAKAVEEHCTEMKALYDEYRGKWISVAMPFLASLVPPGLPSQVVYPFGGGDLLSALATFPDATEYTTISLEPAADVRTIETSAPKQLKPALALIRLHLAKLFEKAHSRTVNLGLEAKNALPGEVVFAMVALALHGYEPTSLRYFGIAPEGTLKYFTAADIASKEKTRNTDVFDNIEVQFRKAGQANAPTKVWRHVAWNLDDNHLKVGGPLLKHLEAKGKVSAMTKAASHFLWANDFSNIRNYLIQNLAWMISDTTGLPPRVAQKAGFVQDTYGTYEGAEPFGPVNNRDIDDFKKLFKANPFRDVTFRYGYPDNHSHGHIVVTRRP
jgi:hypothetical protein